MSVQQLGRRNSAEQGLHLYHMTVTTCIIRQRIEYELYMSSVRKRNNILDIMDSGATISTNLQDCTWN